MSRKTFYRTLANILLVFHILWTLIIVGGAVLMFFGVRYALIELIVLNITLLSAILAGKVCPLTLFEERLRRTYDPHYTNDGSYLATYLNRIFSRKFSTTQINDIVAIIYVLIYASIMRILLAGIGVYIP